MKAQNKKYFTLLFPIMILSLGLQAQKSYKLAADSEFTVSGTSTLHDWTMVSNKTDGQATMTIEKNDFKIDQLSVKLNAETLKSGQSGLDEDAYEALKTERHSDITFRLESVKSIIKRDNHYDVEAEGILSMAGESRMIVVQAQGFPSTKTIRFTGSKTLNMTDFNIDPPTAFLGILKAGEEVTVNFDVTFQTQ